MNDATIRPLDESRPPDQPEWITHVPRPTVALRPMSLVPRSGETGLEEWLRDLSHDLARGLQGEVTAMWIGESRSTEDPMAWFFCAELAGHRIHVNGWEAHPFPFSDTLYAMAIDGLQLAYLPRSGPHLFRNIVAHLKTAHENIAHTKAICTVPKTDSGRAGQQYQELFAAIATRTGLTPHIWRSSGATMMFAILPPPGGSPISGHYLGLVQAWDGAGDASGSVEFYAATDEDGEDLEETTVFLAWDPCPVTVWAHAIAEHYSAHLSRQPALEPKSHEQQINTTTRRTKMIIRTVAELIERLQEFEPNTPLAIASQSAWPMEYTLADVGGADDTKLFLIQGDQVGYLSGDERNGVGWG